MCQKRVTTYDKNGRSNFQLEDLCMIKRKIITTLLATPFSLFLIFSIFFGEWRQPLELVVMTGMFSLFISPYVILYGVPVTFLSDYLSRKLKRARIYVAFIVHIFFGALFAFITNSSTLFPVFGIEVMENLFVQ